MLKKKIKYLLHKIIGFQNYLFLFAIYAIRKLKKKHYEPEFNCFLNMINKNGVVLDIGANIGITTVVLAQKVTTGMVYSFEPMPENLKTLKRIIRRYKLMNVKIFETALGEENGNIEMVLPVMHHTKMQGLSHVVEAGNTTEWNNGVRHTVPIQKLDDITEIQQLEKIDAIKIDVENYEYYVLKGAETLLKKHYPLIYCELWKNEKRTLCLDYLQSLGYQVKVYVEDRLLDYVDQDVTNFILVR